MTFQQKRALVSLIAIGIAAAGYIAKAVNVPPESPLQAAAMLIGASIGLTVMMILAHIVLHVAGDAEDARQPASEQERMIGRAAWRNAAWVMAAELWIVGGLAVVSAPPVLLLQAAAGAFVLAEMVRAAGGKTLN